jgi:putative ABC transport system permease protein
MKKALYMRYTTRSLLRGGQRTLLAIFCVAVGVMAIVSLELVGQMINGALSSNARNANGGDVQVVAQYPPLKEADLAFFDRLKQQGVIVQYAPTLTINGQIFTGPSRQAFSVMVVDPTTFPVIPALTLTTPSHEGLPALLKGNQVVVDQGFVDQTHLHVGRQFVLQLANADQQTIQAQVAGIVADSGVFAQTNDFLLLSLDMYRATLPSGALAYSHVYISTDQNQAQTNAANTAIQREFPLAESFTAADTLKNQETNSTLIKHFLDIAGLLALLVGGVGIVNTMKVLLSRRKVEIAMLKTNGYSRIDLFLLFGLEAGLLGLIGGSIGALLAIGASFLLHLLVQIFFTSLTAPFVLDWTLIGGGVMIGVATALIFGLMPIVEAAHVRPLHVLRELPENRRPGQRLNQLGLLFLLSLLFCVLATLILNDLLWGILAVYGGFALLGLLGLLFSLVPLIIGKLPVPDRFSSGYVCLVAVGVIVAGLCCFVSLTLGGLLLAIALAGYVVVLLPRSWKVNTRLALRNISRQKARTTTTLLAVFIGVFTIGLILNTGENFINQVSAMRSSAGAFNVVVFTNRQERQTLLRQSHTIPGLAPESLQQRIYTDVVPVNIDNQPMERLLPPRNPGSQSGLFGTQRDDVIHLLNSFEGYDVAHNQLPDLKNGVDITEGRSLTAADAGTTNILIQEDLLHIAGFAGKIKVGSELVVTSQDGKTSRTLHVVGIFKPKGFSYIGKVMAPAELVQRLAPAQRPRSIIYMLINGKQIGQAIDRISQIAPNADIRNYAAFGDTVIQYLNDVVLLLIVIASLSLLAAIVMIANAVALAMLERRREIGILKAVGYTSRVVLSGILIENGIVAGTGAWLAMLIVSLVSGLLGVFLGISPSLNWYLGLGMILCTALLAMLTAIAVAWRSAHVRPLEVLRYE